MESQLNTEKLPIFGNLSMLTQIFIKFVALLSLSLPLSPFPSFIFTSSRLCAFLSLPFSSLPPFFVLPPHRSVTMEGRPNIAKLLTLGI